ncbi:MAG: shikimate dehydrogenase [Burkholderiaceae bacterium]
MTHRITGTTALYLIIGDPVGQVRAPEVFNLVFERLGIDAALLPAHVAPSGLEAFLRGAFEARNLEGLFLAIPHKPLVMPFLDEASPIALAAGAVNGVRRTADGRLVGGQFDGLGFVSALAHFGIEFRGPAHRTLIIGAGGGASAIAASMASEGATSVCLYDPVPGRAEALSERVMKHFPACATRAVRTNDPAGYDLVVNASPLGLQHGDALPCEVSRMNPGTAVMDILMKNQPTPFVRAARARGLTAHPGFEMLIQQAPHYLEFFGHADAAARVRRDATFIREMIYPAELAGEIPRAERLAA